MEQNHMLQRPASSEKKTTTTTQDETATAAALPTGSSHPTHAHQQQQRLSYSPPSYAQSHDPAMLRFPEVPTTELPPIQRLSSQSSDGDGNTKMTTATTTPTTLPPLSSLTGAAQALQQPRRIPSQPPIDGAQHQLQQQQQHAAPGWPSLNPLTTYYATQTHAQQVAADSPARMDMDSSSAASAMSAASPPDCLFDGRASSVSLDDPDVRLAAEALGDLRADFVSSPPNSHTAIPAGSPPHTHTHGAGMSSKVMTSRRSRTPEPLLSLLTTSHPLLATTIEGGISAYNCSKNYSPRFKSGAEYVEGYVGPIANTLGSVGRVTGVEGGVRWILGGRRHHSQARQHSDLESGEPRGANKRRRTEGGGVLPVSGGDVAAAVKSSSSSPPAPATPAALGDQQTAQDGYVFKYDRRLSQASTIDTLPAYEEKSPMYTETADGQVGPRQQQQQGAWQSRLLMSTSGLSVAMSEESLRSLKYCLTWLRWANDHISRVINSLKTTLEQYEKVGQADGSAASAGADPDSMDVDSASNGATASQADRRELAARITTLKGDVLKTLRDVIETVSKYAGGALPENARELVKRHLTSLPRKWQLAMVNNSNSTSQSSQGAEGQERQHSAAPSSSQESRHSIASSTGDGSNNSNNNNTKEGAQRVLVLAREGLDMMAQVSLVLDGTINSAEEWCSKLGRRRRGGGEREESMLPQSEKPPVTNSAGDVKMG